MKCVEEHEYELLRRKAGSDDRFQEIHIGRGDYVTSTTLDHLNIRYSRITSPDDGYEYTVRHVHSVTIHHTEFLDPTRGEP